MSDENNFFKDKVTTLRVVPRVVEKVGFSLTVYDREPDKVVFALMDDWGQPFILTDEDQELLVTVSNHVFAKYEHHPADNIHLLHLGHDLDSHMREHYPNRYTGQVRIRRAMETPIEDRDAYGPYRYRYVM